MTSIDTPKGSTYAYNGSVVFKIKLRRNPYGLIKW